MENKTNVSEMIFQNAIDSIELGIEDYKLGIADSKKSKRFQSSVRNLFAGILLLFKSKLAELSEEDDESLLKQKVLPIIKDGVIKWVGEGKKTVDVQQIKERFKSLNISVDWKPFDKLLNYRNDIEHYFDQQRSSVSVVRGHIASNFILIKTFMEQILDVDPQTEFSESTWQTFLKEKGIYDNEIKEKKTDFDKVTWFSEGVSRLFYEHRCPSCDSDLIRIDGEISTETEATAVSFVCRNCGKKWTYQELAREIANNLAERNAWDFKDGGQEIIGYCPNCGNETYCADGEICLRCGEQGPFRCSRCDDDVPICELPIYEESGMCGYCAHMQERMMEDD